MIYECRLDPPPDPLPEPEEPGQDRHTRTSRPTRPILPDPGNWIECFSPHFYPFLEDGSHHFEVRATRPGRQRRPHARRPTTGRSTSRSRTRPSARTRSTRTPGSSPPRRRSRRQARAKFQFAGSDNLTPGPRLKYQCRIDGGAWESCQQPARSPLSTSTPACRRACTRSRCAPSTSRATTDSSPATYDVARGPGADRHDRRRGRRSTPAPTRSPCRPTATFTYSAEEASRPRSGWTRPRGSSASWTTARGRRATRRASLRRPAAGPSTTRTSACGPTCSPSVRSIRPGTRTRRPRPTSGRSRRRRSRRWSSAARG